MYSLAPYASDVIHSTVYVHIGCFLRGLFADSSGIGAAGLVGLYQSVAKHEPFFSHVFCR